MSFVSSISSKLQSVSDTVFEVAQASNLVKYVLWSGASEVGWRNSCYMLCSSLKSTTVCPTCHQHPVQIFLVKLFFNPTSATWRFGLIRSAAGLKAHDVYDGQSCSNLNLLEGAWISSSGWQNNLRWLCGLSTIHCPKKRVHASRISSARETSKTVAYNIPLCCEALVQLAVFDLIVAVACIGSLSECCNSHCCRVCKYMVTTLKEAQFRIWGIGSSSGVKSLHAGHPYLFVCIPNRAQRSHCTHFHSWKSLGNLRFTQLDSLTQANKNHCHILHTYVSSWSALRQLKECH